MTLIEIIITVAIIALIVGITVGYLGDWTDSKLSDTSSQLAGTIKYVYNEAAIKNQYYRLLIDMNDQSFAVEASSEPFKISATEEGTAPPPESESASPTPAPTTPEGGGGGGADGEAKAPPVGGTFSAVSSYLLKPIKLPEGIKIKDVYVDHMGKKLEGGKTAVYFFPNGWVEKAVINLADDKDESFYSLETFPLSGKTKIRTEYFEYKPEEKE
jgi:general secretion pathway protein H